MKQFKRTKAIDVIGRWVENGDKITRYKNISTDTKCSKCNGTDEFCTVCHGQSVEKKLKWYQFVKKLEKWLENY